VGRGDSRIRGAAIILGFRRLVLDMEGSRFGDFRMEPSAEWRKVRFVRHLYCAVR